MADGQWPEYVDFKAKYAERRLTQVEGYELAQILDDDFALDDVESALWQMRHFKMEGFVNSTFQFLLVAQQVLEDRLVDILRQTVVEQVGSAMEHVAEHAVVKFQFVIRNLGFLQTTYIAVEETQWTAQPSVYRCWREGRG